MAYVKMIEIIFSDIVRYVFKRVSHVLSCRLASMNNQMCNYHIFNLVKMVIKTGLILIYVYFVGQKDLSRSEGEQKLFDCVLITIFYMMGLILFTLVTTLYVLLS